MGNEPDTILLIGASRGLGLGLAAEFLQRGWAVLATVRASSARTPLRELADASPGRLEVETLDVNQPDQVAALRQRLAGRSFPLLFVNAGVTGNDDMTIGQVPAADFASVMTTNALSPMRVIEALQDLVPPDGLIGAMSSGQGSLTNNTRGQHELYRGSKAALNMFMRSYAARQPAPGRALALIAPGWVRTGLGGGGAPYTIEETVPAVADVLLAKRGRPGLEYLDRFGAAVPW